MQYLENSEAVTYEWKLSIFLIKNFTPISENNFFSMEIFCFGSGQFHFSDCRLDVIFCSQVGFTHVGACSQNHFAKSCHYFDHGM